MRMPPRFQKMAQQFAQRFAQNTGGSQNPVSMPRGQAPVPPPGAGTPIPMPRGQAPIGNLTQAPVPMPRGQVPGFKKGGMVKKAKGGMMCSPRKKMAMGGMVKGCKRSGVK
jgi:hypothetical protein